MTTIDNLLAGPLALSAVLADPLTKLHTVEVMRARRLRRLIRTGEVPDTPQTRAALHRLEGACSTPYRHWAKDPEAWEQWAIEFDAVFKTAGEAAALALPTPIKPGFKRRQPDNPMSSWDTLQELASRPLEAGTTFRGTTLSERAKAASAAARDRETVRARRHRDAVVRSVIASGGRSAGPLYTLQEVRAGMAPWERVAADMVAVNKMGRPMPTYVGHTLAHKQPYEMV